MPLHTIEQALAHIVAIASEAAQEDVSLTDSNGRVLAAAVTADRPSPPFDKSMMDGFAVPTIDIHEGMAFPIVGEVAAGANNPAALEEATSVRIMTGAPVPAGTAAVIPIEVATVNETAKTVSFAQPPRSKANILPTGEIAAAGSTIVEAGQLIGPGELAALAEFGASKVPVRRQPRVAVLATGDELVPFDETPGPGQIRNSNGPMLAALIDRLGGVSIPLGIARDNVDALDEAITRGLEADILLLSGGVSAGKYDLVPERLDAAGVSEVFHKVAIKPGKPIWFGRADNERQTLVFGLPGNPVSSLVCAQLFVQTAIRKMLGRSSFEPPTSTAKLSAAHRQKGDRTTYWPAAIQFVEGEYHANPLPWRGSADLVQVAAADAWAIFPPGNREFGIGESVDLLLH